MAIHAVWQTIGYCTQARAGYPFRGTVPAHADGDVLAVQMKDIADDGSIDWAGAVRTRLSGRSAADWLLDGDVVFIARGNRLLAACVEQPPRRSVCGPHLYHLRVREPRSVMPQFLAWQINQQPAQRVLRQMAEGSNQLSIRRPMLESVHVAVPSLDNQRRIVALARLARQERAAFERLMRNREHQLQNLAASLAAAPVHNPFS